MFTSENYAAFRPYTKVENRGSFLVITVPRFVSTEDASFINFQAISLTLDLEFLISEFAVLFR